MRGDARHRRHHDPFRGAPVTAQTASDGTYSLAGLSKGSYTITPSAANFMFKPAGRKVTIGEKSITGRNFTAVPLFSLSGTVTSGGNPLSGVTVRLTGAAKGSTTTGSDGSYSFADIPGGSYTVTPSAAGYSFNPSHAKITLNKNTSGQDFAATNN